VSIEISSRFNVLDQRLWSFRFKLPNCVVLKVGSRTAVPLEVLLLRCGSFGARIKQLYLYSYRLVVMASFKRQGDRKHWDISVLFFVLQSTQSDG